MAEPITSLTPAPTVTTLAPSAISAGVHALPDFDVADLLPEQAQDRRRKLRLRRSDAHRLIPEFETVRQSSLERVEAAQKLERLKAHPQDFGRNLPEDHPLVKEAQRHLDKMTADFKRLTELQEVRSAAFQSASAALANTDAWLRDGRPPGTTLQDHVGPEPKLNKNETVLDAIERLRRDGRGVKAKIHTIRSSCFPRSYCKQRMREQIEALAMQAPSVSRLVELDGPVEFQTRRMTSEVHAEQRLLAFTEVPDAVALVAWLHKSALIAALDREIDTEAHDGALSHEARAVAEAEAQADLLDIERQETDLVFLAQSQGLPIEHRGDASPLAILGCVLVTAPRAETPTTSPWLSWPMMR